MRTRLALVALFVTAGAPGAAVAQPPPVPAVITATPTSTPPSTWGFSLRAEGTWYENAPFVGPVLADAAWMTSGRATLSNSRRFKDGSFAISGFGGAIYYPEIDALNQPTYGGTLGLDWSASRRSRVKLNLRYERLNTRMLVPADAEGLPLPTSLADYATAAASWEVRLSQRWQLALDGSYLSREYEDVVLTDSDQVYGGLRLGRQLGRSGLFFLSYAYSSAWFDEGKERAHQALVGGRHSVQKGLGFEIAGGVGYVESTETFYPAGRVGLYAVGRKARLDLVYYRDFGQAYGYGRQMVGDLASASFTWSAVRRLTFDASYNYGYRRDPSDEDYTIQSGIAAAGFSWRVGGGFGLGVHYAWERNETSGLPVFEGGRVTAVMTYGVDWQ
jgi:hypothetical protein